MQESSETVVTVPDSSSHDVVARDGEDRVGGQGEEKPEYDYNSRPGFSGKNLCICCKVDMGDCNGRQYCGKWKCDDEWMMDNNYDDQGNNEE